MTTTNVWTEGVTITEKIYQNETQDEYLTRITEEKKKSDLAIERQHAAERALGKRLGKVIKDAKVAILLIEKGYVSLDFEKSNPKWRFCPSVIMLIQTDSDPKQVLSCLQKKFEYPFKGVKAITIQWIPSGIYFIVMKDGPKERIVYQDHVYWYRA